MVKHSYIDQKFSLDERENYLAEISSDSSDGIVLHTCNRVEHYRGEGYIPEEIVNHLFLVTSGLKSSFIGDTSIQGQVKEAYNNACMRKTVTSSLHSLFQKALRTGKRVRSETAISKGAITYPQAALEVLLQQYNSFAGVKITILGVHNINEKIIKSLVKRGAETMFIGNRTFHKASMLAAKYNCTAFRFDKLNERLKETDILISATSAPHFIVRFLDFPKFKSMFVIDLAVPRDVEPKIGDLLNVTLVNLEDVEFQVNRNLDKRKDEIHKALAIVKAEVNQFMLNQRRA